MANRFSGKLSTLEDKLQQSQEKAIIVYFKDGLYEVDGQWLSLDKAKDIIQQKNSLKYVAFIPKKVI